MLIDLLELKEFNSRKFRSGIFWTFWSNSVSWQADQHLTDVSGLNLTGDFSFWKADRTGFGQPTLKARSTNSRPNHLIELSEISFELSGIGTEGQSNRVRLADTVGSVNRHLTESPWGEMSGFVSVNWAYGKLADRVRSAEVQSSVNRRVTDQVTDVTEV